MLGGFDAGRIRVLPLLMVLAVAWIFVGSQVIYAEQTCGCYGYNCCPSRIEVEQRLWTIDAYRFLYADDYYSAGWPYNYRLLDQNQSIDNGTAGLRLYEGDKLYLAGSYEKSAAAYAEAVELDPSLSKGWLNLGNSLYFLGRYLESLDAYDSVLKLEPHNEYALRGKIQSLLALNRTSQADATQKTLESLQSRHILSLGSTPKTVVVGDH